jgi:hypothetical protein
MPRFQLWLLFLISVAVVWPQTPTGEFTGRVTDPSGAAVAGAKITVTDLATGVERQTESNDTGNYTVPLLPPGKYQLTAQKEGFRPMTQSGYTLNVDQIVRVDFALKLGSVSDTVSVVAETPLIETSTASMGTIIGNQKIANLPLNTRNSYRLSLLAPGVIAAPAFGDAFNSADSFIINGGRSNLNEILIDGVSNVPSGANPILVVAMFPSPDALQEFKVQTTIYSAEYGRTAGGVINMVMKSGTNQIHGSAYDFLRNSILDSNNFFANQAGTPLASFKRNQFGGTIGGPIKKDVLFYFLSYEGLRLSQAADVTRTVPTAQQQQGDFSHTFALSGGTCKPVTIYDPTSTTPGANGTYVRTPFPGDKIPVIRLDPVGQKIASYYPLPNTSGNPCTGANNFFAQRTLSTNTDQGDARLDWNPNDRNRAFLSLSKRALYTIDPNFYGNAAEPTVGFNGDYYPSESARLDYTRVQTPYLVFDARFGATRFERHFDQQVPGFDLTTLGFPRWLANQVLGPQAFPSISVAGYAGMGNQGGATSTDQRQTMYSLNASASWVHGKHSIKTGLDARVNQAYEFSTFNNTGAFSFTQSFTQGPNANVPSAIGGNGFASLLLGTGTGSVSIVPPVFTSSPYYAFYIQDDYKITSKLTLNLGLRYDLELGRTARNNELSWWNFTVPSPLATLVPQLPNLRGGLEFVGVNGNSPRQFNTDANNWGPRFGFAYSIDPKTVVRGGYGIFYVPYVGVATGTASGIDGFESTTTWPDSNNNGLTPLYYLSNAFPSGVEPPTGSSEGLLTSIGQTIGATSRDGAIDRGSKVGYVQQWSFTLQRQLPRDLSVEAAYVGSKGTDLMDNGWQLDQLAASQLTLGTKLQQPVANPFYGIITSGPLSLPTIPYGQLLLPYPQFNGVYDYRPAAASSIYHSVQASMQKRFADGSSVLVAYTGGKLIDDSSGTSIGAGGAAPEHLDVYNRRLDRAVSAQDVSKNLVASFVYAIPFGRGKRFGSNLSPFVDNLIGEWQINGIIIYSTGQPIAITAPNNSGSYSTVQRPNQVCDAYLPGRSTASRLSEWFNTSCFSQPAAFTFGDGPATEPNVRTDSVRNIDLSLFKEFPFREHVTAQFRAEAFNFFNTPRFSGPGTVLGNAGFGVVSSQANSPRQIQLALRVLF